MTALADFDPFHPDVVQEPHAFYAALRREAPLYRLPNGAYYLISRYRDVRDAAMNTEVYSSNLVAVMFKGLEQPELLALEGAGSGAADALAIADPPVHARQRKLSNQAFSMRRVAALEPAIRALAESLIGAILPRGGARWSSADWMREVAGEPLPKGSRVMLLWGAANRDGDEFPNPDAIDLARPNGRSHLGFGFGIHHCIGAALARLETRVTLETLLVRTSVLRRAEGEIAHVPSLLVRCLALLPVELST